MLAILRYGIFTFIIIYINNISQCSLFVCIYLIMYLNNPSLTNIDIFPKKSFNPILTCMFIQHVQRINAGPTLCFLSPRRRRSSYVHNVL